MNDCLLVSEAYDYIFIDDLKLHAKVGLSAFSKEDQSFPLTISCKVKVDPDPAEDAYALSYGDLCRCIRELVTSQKSTASLLQLLDHIYFSIPEKMPNWTDEHKVLHLRIRKDGGLLRGAYEMVERNYSSPLQPTYGVYGLRSNCIIGIYDHERAHRQEVIINLVLIRHDWVMAMQDMTVNERYTRKKLEEMLIEVDQSNFMTVESLADSCVDNFVNYEDTPYDWLYAHAGIRVAITKPSAIIDAEASGICITRPIHMPKRNPDNGRVMDSDYVSSNEGEEDEDEN